jgi:hypothetical protein
MITKNAELTKERLSLFDKKMLKDPKAHNVTVLVLRRASGGSPVGCCGLVQGVGCFDIKFVAVENDAVLGQLVLHASGYCKANGGDQLIALFSGARADADKKWGPFGFKFVGVGPAPSFEVRMAKQIK